MASQTNPFSVHLHDTAQINILPSSQHNTESRWDDPPSAPYWDTPLADVLQNVPPATDERSDSTVFHQVFLKAKPRSRGLFQILVAHSQLALGIILNFVGGRNLTWHSYIVFWGPPFLIISGFVAVTTQAVPSLKLVTASTILHSIGIAVSFLGLALSFVDVFRIYPCGFNCQYGNMGTLSIISILLMTNLVQLSISSNIVVYGWRALKHHLANPPQISIDPNPNPAFSEPPAYSEISANFPQSPAFLQPSPLSQSQDFPPPPSFSHSPDFPPPPAFSQSPDFPKPPAFYWNPAFNETEDISQPPPYSE